MSPVAWSWVLRRCHGHGYYEDALYNKGYELDALGNHTEAIKYYDKTLAIKPNACERDILI
jgi:tetratricopeptide (TPR) repeat protein